MRPSLGRALRFFAASAALSRGVPFLLNVAVARRLTPAELGVPTVHFALVSTAVLTVREGFRRACLRHDAATALAVGWLAVPAGAVVALIVAAGARVALGAEASSPYGTAVAVVCAAAFAELCAEPFHLAATRNGALAVRLVAETSSTCCRAAVTAWLLLAPPPRWRALPVPLCFAVAQLAGAFALLAAYLAGAAAQPRTVWPGAPRAPDRQALRLLRDFSAQAAWKLVLAEGDKAALLAQSAPVATGVYGLATNLGGLAARLVLQPLEEAAFCAFAAGSTKAGKRAASESLRALLRALLLAGLFCACVGPSYAFLVLRVVYGAQWAAAPDAASTLGSFALLLPLLAVNGVSEAYTAAVMTPPQLRASNAVLLVSTILQSVTGILASRRLGPAALLAGTAAGLVLRIAAALRFAVASDGARKDGDTVAFISSLLPRRRVFVVLAAGGLLAAASNSALQAAPFSHQAALIHLTVGLGAAAVAAVAAMRWERSTLTAVRAALQADRKRD